MRELGTLRAIGTTPEQLAALLLAEAIWLGLLGGAAGAAVGAAGVFGLNALGLRMPPPPGAVDPIDLRLALVPEAMGGAVVLMVVVLIVAALVPILRAIRIKVVEALAHV
jgi:putative ABC transport system permease protein